MPLKTTVARCGRGRQVGWILSAMAGLTLVSACDSQSFVPPPPPELIKPPETSLASLSGKGVDAASSVGHPSSAPRTARKAGAKRAASLGTAKIIELLLAHPIDADRYYLVQVLRREAGKAKMVFRLVEPDSGTSFSLSALAKEIRAAVGRGASGLIVEPEEDPVVVDALREAVDQGMSVLLLDRPIAPRDGQAIPCIRYGSFSESGQRIVQTALDAVKLFHRPGPARIILLHHRSTDPYAALRLRSIADALKAASQSFSSVEFEGDIDHAVESLEELLVANPKVDLVFADDDIAMIATHQVLSDWTKSGRPEFLFAGYIAYDVRSSSELIRQATAYGDRSVETFGQKTFQTIQSLTDGQPVGDLVEVPIRIHRRALVFVPTPAEPAKTSSSSK